MTYVLLSFQMRYTKKVSMWPVGLITKYGVSSPIVRNGTISGFYDGWIGGRKFPVDMAGFAVNVNFLLSRPNASMPYKPGYEEDGFLKSLSPLNLTEIELMATNCTEVWIEFFLWLFRSCSLIEKLFSIHFGFCRHLIKFVEIRQLLLKSTVPEAL